MSLYYGPRRALLSKAAAAVVAALAPFAATVILGQHSATSTHATPFVTAGTTVAADVGDVVAVAVHTAAAITAFSDNHGNTWSTPGPITAGGKLQIYTSKLTTAMPIGSTFTVTYGGSVDDTLITAAVVVPTPGTVETAAATASLNTATPALSFTTGFAGEMALMFVYTNGGGADLATPAGWTLLIKLNPATPPIKWDSVFVFAKLESAPGTDASFSSTQTTSVTGLNAVVIKPS